MAIGGVAEAYRLFQHRIEHRRQIAGRGVDHLQHLGGRGLLFQRLPLLGDQPRVLHRDHRLGGEVLQQRDLLVGERPHFLAVDRDVSEQRARPCGAARSRHGASAIPKFGWRHRGSGIVGHRGSVYLHRHARASFSKPFDGSERSGGSRLTQHFGVRLPIDRASPTARNCSPSKVISAPIRRLAQAVSPFPGSHRTPAPDRRARR